MTMHDDVSDRSITSGTHALDVELSDRHWREDNIGGWGNDPRPLYLRVAEVLVANLLVFGACVVALLLVVVIVD